MLRFMRTIALFALLMITAVASVCQAEVERRRDQFGKDFGYYIYPIVGEIPGLGTAAGAGASVLNIGGADTDVSGYYIEGDFEAKGIVLLDYHIRPNRLVFDFGYNDYLVAPIVYDRGMLSDPNDVIYPKVEGSYLLAQLTLTFDERRYEFYVRGLTGRERLHQILDTDGNAYAGIDTAWHSHQPISIGATVDLTDDRLDPRRGMRFELSSRLPTDNEADQSEYFVNDYNLTGYIPFRRWDTLALNLFYSHALVTRTGETDFSTLQQTSGLNCDQYPPGASRDECLITEAKHINNLIANNRYGTASPLGGTQRLRSFDNYRFYAANALFYGIEYRWNLTDERTPFDIYIAKGIRTGIQLAAFWERGMVADERNDLFDTHRTSYGIGFRLILSGVIIRFDLADGDEGVQSQLFITYPWSMFSVDNPS
ncbi:MAG TPA: BamA/TamA family outer membrane protein [Gammaproteobacteria bacterium]